MVAKVGARWGPTICLTKLKVILNGPHVIKVKFLYGRMTLFKFLQLFDCFFV